MWGGRPARLGSKTTVDFYQGTGFSRTIHDRNGGGRADQAPLLQ